MRRKAVIAGILALAASGCGVAGESPPAGNLEQRPQDVNAGQEFRVALDRSASSDSVTHQIATAGAARIGRACEQAPDESVRIFNPFAPGQYTDMPCRAFLGEGSGRMLDPLFANERIGVAQQKGVIGLVSCGIFAGGFALFLHYGLCPHATNQRDRERCDELGLWSGVGIGILCSIPF